MDHKLLEQMERFASASRRCASHGLMRCSSGNMSVRLDAEHMLVKGSRSWMESLRADQVSYCRISDGALLNQVRPSVETGFHSGVLRERPDMNVVLHFQTPSATLLACKPEVDQINFNLLIEIPFYIGPVAVVPYLLPGSPELAHAVITAMHDHDMVILRNHGLVTVGRDYDDVIQKAVFFEMACALIVQGGASIQPLSDESVARLRAAAGGQSYSGA